MGLSSSNSAEVSARGSRPLEHPAVFGVRFSRCSQLLHLIACRILGDPESTDNAIKNCWLTASRNPPRFEYEGAFRGWLLRVLIEEALAVLRESQGTREPAFPYGQFPVSGLNTYRRDEDDADRSVLSRV